MEHTSGFKVAHVDALSRHVATVGGGNELTKQAILKEQGKDGFCIRQKQNGFAAKSEFSLDSDGVLYRRHGGKEPQIVVPHSLVHDVIVENHDPVFAAHPSSQRTFELISLRY